MKQKLDSLNFERTLLNALPHPVFTISPDGHFSYCNNAAEVFFGISRALLYRHLLSDHLASDHPVLSMVEQVRSQQSPMNEYLLPLELPRLGTKSLVDIHITPVAEKGEVMVVIEERTIADKIRKQLTHRQAARSVTGLAAMLAHEIKNPLSGIRGAAQLLDGSVEDADRGLTRLITEEADRIVKLVDRMEVFSDERPPERTEVNIHAVLDHVLQLSKNGFAQGIEFIEEYDPSLPPIPANRDQLIQVFLNLMKNAAEAIHTGERAGRITLRTAYRPGVRLSVPGHGTRTSLPLEISVIDNGPGVLQEILPYLFEPFITSKNTGTGLGLALVAKIINSHGGVIECESDHNGTAFRILMPMRIEGMDAPK